MLSRMLAAALAAVLGVTFVVVPGESLSRPAGPGGRTFLISPGLRHPALRSPSPSFARHAFNRGEFGFPFWFPTSSYGFGFPVNEFEFGAPQPGFGGCASFYCTHYDPSYATYADPYRSPAYPYPGAVNPVIVRHPGCDTEIVTVPNRTIKIVRC
jgi:hypothetical protein